VTLDRRVHWERIYAERKPDEVSWFQEVPRLSLELIRASGVPKDAALLDVGGGASRLVDFLLEEGCSRISVLDIAGRALDHSRERLGERAKLVNWIEADITTFSSRETYDLWHDRAVFHFLTEESDRRKYVACVRGALKPGGALILAAFAPDGPSTCSGLPVRRCDAGLLQSTLGEGFELLQEASEVHRTPWSTEQKFGFFLFKKK
jgi:SAM-dependent methyltransferase